jgi:predicted peroxiredoxin
MTTAPRLVIIITHAGRDPGAVTLGFLTASAALTTGRHAAVLLRGEGVLCATAEGWAATLHEAGYPPLREVPMRIVKQAERCTCRSHASSATGSASIRVCSQACVC